MANDDRKIDKPTFNAGPYLAKIVSHLDSQFMGTLQVELLRDVGNLPDRTGNIFQVKYLSPFYGVTGHQYLGSNPTYDDTQKSYGMWMIPPDVGSIVMVIFVEGNTKNGYWIGCVQDTYMNFMIPGLAATDINNAAGIPTKSPVAEYNKQLSTDSQTDTTLIKKPIHPFTQVLQKQGLLADEYRGITTSSARREAPSAVFGISTPGPVDRKPGAPTGKVGKHGNKVDSAFISRLGGTTFVMDDGDDAYVRMTHASEGPPTYAAVEQGEKGGDPTLPHNELVRIRTRTGHQILLHNTEDLIYIGNARGTTWVELTSNGKIDIFAEDSVSIHTKNDFNFTADRDINFSAGGSINLTAGEDYKLTAGNNVDLVIGANGNITTAADFNLNTAGSNKFTAGGGTDILSGGNHTESAAIIHMNGPGAASATSAAAAKLPSRIPQAEPWAGHENLNPQAHTPENTVAGKTTAAGILTKIVDTFRKIGK